MKNDPPRIEASHFPFPSWLFAWLALILAVTTVLTWKWYHAPTVQRFTQAVVIDLPPAQELAQNTYIDDIETTWQDEDLNVTASETSPETINFLRERFGVSPEERLLLGPRVDIYVSDRDNLLTEEELVEIAISRIPPTEVASP